MKSGGFAYGKALGRDDMAADTETRRIGFLLVPKFSFVAFINAIEPLRVANRFSDTPLYRWRILSDDGEAVVASNGMPAMVEGRLDDESDPDILFVCSSFDPQLYEKKETFGHLRRLARHGSALGGLCTGAYLLARAGLLDGARCTLHWENLDGFREDFPEIEATGELFEIDRERYTAAGGTAPLDMMLTLIGMHHGTNLALQVSEYLIHERIRSPHDHQRMTLRSRLRVSNPRLLDAVSLMEQELESPLGLEEVAQRCGISKRQLERLFRTYLGCSPGRYYVGLRLKRARTLLEQTSLTVTAVGIACGFVSASHFSRCYREQYGHSPRQERAPH